MTSTTSTAASASVCQTPLDRAADELAVVGADGDRHALAAGCGGPARPSPWPRRRRPACSRPTGGRCRGRPPGCRSAGRRHRDFPAPARPGRRRRAGPDSRRRRGRRPGCGTARASAKGRSTRSVTFCCASSRPAGSSTFWRVSALSTSAGVRLKPASRSGCSQIAHRRPRLAADEHLGDAVDRAEPVGEVAVDPVAELQRRPARLGDDQEHDRRWRRRRPCAPPAARSPSGSCAAAAPTRSRTSLAAVSIVAPGAEFDA